MRPIIGFLTFWYDFVVGDDWTVAVGVVIALLAASVWRVARQAGR